MSLKTINDFVDSFWRDSHLCRSTREEGGVKGGRRPTKWTLDAAAAECRQS